MQFEVPYHHLVDFKRTGKEIELTEAHIDRTPVRKLIPTSRTIFAFYSYNLE